MASKTHSVKTYNYYFSAWKAGADNLQLWDAQNQRIAVFNFVDETSPLPAPWFSSDLTNCGAAFRRSALAGLIDMLRNENPVSLYISDTPNVIYLFTGSVEPVGEGES